MIKLGSTLKKYMEELDDCKDHMQLYRKLFQVWSPWILLHGDRDEIEKKVLSDFFGSIKSRAHLKDLFLFRCYDTFLEKRKRSFDRNIPPNKNYICRFMHISGTFVNLSPYNHGLYSDTFDKSKRKDIGKSIDSFENILESKAAYGIYIVPERKDLNGKSHNINEYIDSLDVIVSVKNPESSKLVLQATDIWSCNYVLQQLLK